AGHRHARRRQVSVRSLPLTQESTDRRALDGHQAIDGLANGVAPAGAAVLTFRVDADAHLPLQVQRLEDGVVLHVAQLVAGDAALAEVPACLQQLRRSEQTTDVIGAIGWSHGPL